MASLQFTEGDTTVGLASTRKQLIPNIIDGLAAARPNATWSIVPRSPTSWEEGKRKISYRDLANAVNGLARYMLTTLGAPKRPFESVAYFGVWDPRYHILTAAAVKAGYKAVLPSGARGSRNILDFLDEVECDKILVADSSIPLARELADEPKITLHQISSLASLLDDEAVHVPYTKTFANASSNPLLVLHTSGSTGKPKPIVYTHDWAATYLLKTFSVPPPGFRSLETQLAGQTALIFSPQAHCGAFYANLLASLYCQIVCVYPLSSAMLTRDAFFETLKHNDVDFTMTPSFLLEQLAQSPSDTSFLADHVRIVAFAGAPLTESTGEVLSRRVQLFSMYGTSEAGTMCKMAPGLDYRPEWWNFVLPNPVDGFEMRPLPGAENSYEAIVVRNPDPGMEQPIFKMTPGQDEWSTGDVFSAHPVSHGASVTTLFRYMHRRDDSVALIVDDPLRLQALQTLFPLKFEQALSGTELIKSALVIGNRKPKAGLLVELAKPRQNSPDNIRGLIMEEAKSCMSLLGAEIGEEYIILLPTGETLPRTAKGNVARGAALTLYRDEIDRIYLGASA